MNNTYLTKRQDSIRPLLDKLAALKLELNTLQNQKNLSQLEAQEARVVLGSINQSIESLNAQLLVDIDAVEEFIGFTKEVLNTGSQHIKATEDIISQYMVVIAALDSKIKDSTSQLQKVQEERAKVLENIQAEEKRLSSRKRDLDIYKERLQAKAMELGVNIVIRF